MTARPPDASAPLDGDDSLHLDRVFERPVSSQLADRIAGATLDDVATIIYTSGTTGDPKGAVLTFGNLLTQFEAVDAYFTVGGHDRSLSFLPLSHADERVWTFYILLKGAENFYLGDPKRIAETLQEVQPTCMVSVPRLYEKIYATARHRLSTASPAKRRLFDWALGVGRRVGYAKARGETVPPWLEHWARERGITSDSLRAMVKDTRIVAFIAERIEQQQAVLAHHERVKKFTLLSESFSQMGGEITPTLKNIRAAIAKKYERAINAMYASDPSEEAS